MNHQKINKILLKIKMDHNKKYSRVTEVTYIAK